MALPVSVQFAPTNYKINKENKTFPQNVCIFLLSYGILDLLLLAWFLCSAHLRSRLTVLKHATEAASLQNEQLELESLLHHGLFKVPNYYL